MSLTWFESISVWCPGRDGWGGSVCPWSPLATSLSVVIGGLGDVGDGHSFGPVYTTVHLVRSAVLPVYCGPKTQESCDWSILSPKLPNISAPHSSTLTHNTTC